MDDKKDLKEKGRGHPQGCLCDGCDDLMSEWNMVEKEEPGFAPDFRNLKERFHTKVQEKSQHTTRRAHELFGLTRSHCRDSFVAVRRNFEQQPSNSQAAINPAYLQEMDEFVHNDFWAKDRADEERLRRERARMSSYHDIVLVEEEFGFMDMGFSMDNFPEYKHDSAKELELFEEHLKTNGFSAAVMAQPIPAHVRGKYWSQLVSLNMSDFEMEEEYEHKKKFAMSKIGVSPHLDQVPGLGCNLVEVLSDHFPLPEDTKDTKIEQLRLQFKRIMCVLARFNADILRAVGIADTVGLLLSFVSEEETFWIIHEMLKRSKSDRWYFQLNASQWESVLRSFVLLLRQRHRKLYETLGFMSKDQDKGWKDLAESWFSRLFVNCFSPLCRARLIDLFLLDGIETLYRVGLALVGELQPVLEFSKCVEEALLEVEREIASRDFSDILDSKKSKIRFVTKSKINKLHELTANEVGVIGQKLEVFYNPTPSEDSKIMVKPTHWLVIYSALPLNLRTYDPILRFRGSSHGFLLANLIRKVKGLEYTIILIRSQNGEVFGSFTAEEWKNSLKYYGKRSSFVFSLVSLSLPSTTSAPTPSAPLFPSTIGSYSPASSSSPSVPPAPKKPRLVASGDVYNWKLGRPETFQFVDQDALCVGQSMRVDDELGKGYSRCCPTFASPGFCVDTTFDVSDVEVWGLKHPSQDKCK